MKKKRADKLNKKYIFSLFFIFILLGLIPTVYPDETTEDAYGSHIGGLTIQQYNPNTSNWFNQYQKYHENYSGETYEENETVYLDGLYNIRYSVDCLLNNTWAQNKSQLASIVGLGLNITGDITYLNPVLTDEDYAYNLNGFWHYSFITTDPDAFDAANETATAEFISFYYNGSSWLIIDTWRVDITNEIEDTGETVEGIIYEDFETFPANPNGWDNWGNIQLVAGAAVNGSYGGQLYAAGGYDWINYTFNPDLESFKIDTYFNFRAHTSGSGGTESFMYVRTNSSQYMLLKYYANFDTDYRFYIEGVDDVGFFRVNYDSGNMTDFDYDSYYLLTWEMNTTGYISLKMNGTLETYYSGTYDFSGYAITSFDMGFLSYDDGTLWFDDLYLNYFSPPASTPDPDYTMFFIGIAGVIIMVGSPSWFAMKLKGGIRDADEAIRRFVFALLLFVMGYCLIIVWLGEFL